MTVNIDRYSKMLDDFDLNIKLDSPKKFKNKILPNWRTLNIWRTRGLCRMAQRAIRHGVQLH